MNIIKQTARALDLTVAELKDISMVEALGIMSRLIANLENEINMLNEVLKSRD